MGMHPSKKKKMVDATLHIHDMSATFMGSIHPHSVRLANVVANLLITLPKKLYIHSSRIDPFTLAN